MPPHVAPGRNDPCHCGSGRKYKLCCLEKDEAGARDDRARAAAQAEAAAPESAEGKEAAPAAPRRPRPQGHQPWRGGAQNTRGFQKFSTPRKAG